MFWPLKDVGSTWVWYCVPRSVVAVGQVVSIAGVLSVVELLALYCRMLIVIDLVSRRWHCVMLVVSTVLLLFLITVVHCILGGLL